MLRISHVRAICVIAVTAMALSACASPSEPARTATHGPSDTSTAEALVRIAHASLKAGDPGSAISMLKRAHEIDPSSVSILAELGHTLGAVQAWPESAGAYREAAALAPKDPDIRRGYGGALLKLNELALAEVEYRAALALKEEPSTLEGLAVCLDLEGHHDEAEANFRKAYQLDPQDAALRSNLALSLALWGKSNEAVALLAPLAAAPDATPRQRQNLALAFGLAGDLDQAAALSRLDLGEAAVRNNLAYFETLKGLSPVMRVRAIMGAETQPPLPDRKPIAAASLGADRAESPSNPIERPSSPASHTPAHAEKRASISEPTAKPTPTKAAKAKIVEPHPVEADETTAAQPTKAAEATSARPAAGAEKPVAVEAKAVPTGSETSEPAADEAAPVAAADRPASAEADTATAIQPAKAAEATKPDAAEAEAATATPETGEAATDESAPAAADRPASAETDTTEHADTDKAAAGTDRHVSPEEPVGTHTYVVPTVIATWHADEPSDQAPTEPNVTKAEAAPSPAAAKMPDQSASPHVEAPATNPAPKPAS